MSKSLDFKDKVVIITGAGSGLGRSYAEYFSGKGAKLVLNNHLRPGANIQEHALTKLRERLLKTNKNIVLDWNSCLEGSEICKTALTHFGRVDVLINNAGILRDVSFMKMKEEEWQEVLDIHLLATRNNCAAVWNLMREQKFGRIVNTCSGQGLFGAFGQANYASAKMGILGMTKSLAKEGELKNIKINAIAPVAASKMTETVLSKKALENLKPEYVVPLVAYLAHESCTESGEIFEVGSGFISKLRWERNEGMFFNLPFSVEDVRDNFNKISHFSANGLEYPTNSTDIFTKFFENIDRIQQKQIGTQQTQQYELKSVQMFQLMQNYLETSQHSKLLDKLNAVYNFGIQPGANQPVQQWWIVSLLKKDGKGSVKQGNIDNADVEFRISDSDFVELCLGKIDPYLFYLSGRLKIKGNMKQASLFNLDYFPLLTQNLQIYLILNRKKNIKYYEEKKKLYDANEEFRKKLANEIEIKDIECKKIFYMINNWLNQSPELTQEIQKINAIFTFKISLEEDGPIVAYFKVNLKTPPLSAIQVDKPFINADATIYISDQVFCDICQQKINEENAFLQGKLRIVGNRQKANLFKASLIPFPNEENLKKFGHPKL